VGSPLTTAFYLGQPTGSSYGLLSTTEKALADFTWLYPSPALPGWPSGLFLTGQHLTCDGLAPAVVSALITAAAIDGPQHWLQLIPMLGGLRETIRVLCA
jgi:hypothetical protein